MKNLTIAFLALFVNASAMAATPAKLVDGKVKFPAAQLGSDFIWDQAQVDKILLSTPAAPIVPVVPSILEISLATSTLKFANYSDYEKCRDSQSALEDKLGDLLPSQAKNIPVQFIDNQSKNDPTAKGK